MYIATHIRCNTRAINKAALCKFSRDTWLFGNRVRVQNFQSICRETGSQIRLVGAQWDGEHIPQSMLIYRADDGQVKGRLI